MPRVHRSASSAIRTLRLSGAKGCSDQWQMFTKITSIACLEPKMLRRVDDSTCLGCQMGRALEPHTAQGCCA